MMDDGKTKAAGLQSGQAPSLKGFTQGARPVLSVPFPEMQFIAEVLLAAGFKLVDRLTVGGTHEVELTGIAPTGKQAALAPIGARRRLCRGQAPSYDMAPEVVAAA